MSASPPAAPRPETVPAALRVLLRTFGWAAGLVLAGVLALLLLVAVSLAVAYPNLPSIASLTDYRPKLPLRCACTRPTACCSANSARSGGP